jgi:glutathione S-transferase
MGRHSCAEVYAIGKAALSALAVYLQEQPYFMGEEPTTLDATAYAFLTRVLWAPYESPLKTHLQTLPNLVGYCQRMREQYSPGKAQKERARRAWRETMPNPPRHRIAATSGM